MAIPVLGRPQRVRPLVESIQASEGNVRLRPLFIVSTSDGEERSAIIDSDVEYLIADWLPERGDFAKKMNLAVSSTSEEWFLAGADDLTFQPNWADIAIAVAKSTEKHFVATNDCANPLVVRGKHATHPLVHRSYLELGTIDEPGKLYHENYSHQCVDNEATGTAMYRDEYVFAQFSVVQHNHPIFPRNGVRVPMDATYEKGMRDGKEDIALLRTRQHLWGENVVGSHRPR